MLTKRQLKYKVRINIGKLEGVNTTIESYNARIKKAVDRKNKLNESLLYLQKECIETFGHIFKNDICELCNKSRSNE